MKKNRTRTTFATVLILAGFLAFVAPLQATLIGDTISGGGLTPVSATIGAGIEFTGIVIGPNALQFDFAASTLTISDGILVGWSGFDNYVFSNFDDVITGLSIASNTGFSGTIVNNFSFTDHSITLDMSDSVRIVDSVLVFNIGTPSVPEPATLLLLGLGLMGLAGVRRKFKK